MHSLEDKPYCTTWPDKEMLFSSTAYMLYVLSDR